MRKFIESQEPKCFIFYILLHESSKGSINTFLWIELASSNDLVTSLWLVCRDLELLPLFILLAKRTENVNKQQIFLRSSLADGECGIEKGHFYRQHERSKTQETEKFLKTGMRTPRQTWTLLLLLFLVTKSCLTLWSWTVAHQAPLFMGFPRKE